MACDENSLSRLQERGKGTARRRYFLSTTCFNCASPFSKSGPSICSMLTNRQIALPMKVFVPLIVLMVLATGLNAFIGVVERWVAPWQVEITGRDQ